MQRQPLRLNAGDRRRAVVRFLRGLRPRERHVLALNIHERLSAEEIAGVTSLPPCEVRSLLRRLLAGVESALVAEEDALWRKFARRNRSR